MQAGLPEGLVEIDKYEKAQEIGIRSFENNSSTRVYLDHSNDHSDIYVSSQDGNYQIALMDEIGFNWGAGTPYLYSGFKESALAAEFVTNEYRTDARVEIGDIITAYYSINNYDESLIMENQ